MACVIAKIENKPWEVDRSRLLHRYVCSCGDIGPWEMGAPGTSEPPFTVHRNHHRNHNRDMHFQDPNRKRMPMPPQPTPHPDHVAGLKEPPIIENILGLDRVEPIYHPIEIGEEGTEHAIRHARRRDQHPG